jgi:VanZ family protein
VLRWLIWGLFVIAWTIALELPIPQPEMLPGGAIVMSHRYLIAKSIHVSAFAVLAALSGWVLVPARYRWIMMFLVMLHAWGTEMLQEMLVDYCKRGGSLTDVAFDVLGITIGVALSWKWWTREDLPDKSLRQETSIFDASSRD